MFVPFGIDSAAIKAMFFWMACLFAGCGTSGSGLGPGSVPEDTSGSWPSPEIAVLAERLDADTITSDTSLRLFNDPYQLRITGIGRDGSNHDREFHIELTGPGGAVYDTVLTKESFADSLDAEFLERAGLYALEYNFARSVSLYLNAYIGVDGTDHVQPIGLLITYSGERKGRMLYWLPKQVSTITE